MFATGTAGSIDQSIFTCHTFVSCGCAKKVNVDNALTTIHSVKHIRFVRILLQLSYVTFHIGQQPVADEKPMFGISIGKFPQLFARREPVELGKPFDS